MKDPHLGCAEISLSRMGLGSWPFGGGYDWGPCDESAAQRTIEFALEQGINWVDTAPVYGDGQSEKLLGRVLSGRRQEVLLAGKCGLIKDGSWTNHDLRPASIRQQLEGSLLRLKTDYLDLYQIHYPDPQVPLENAVEELLRLHKEGKIRAIGLCNVNEQQIRLACGVTPIFSVQNEYSLLHPMAGEKVLEVCQELGVRFIGYGVLSGGILSGKYKTAPNLRRADARNYFYKCYRGNAFLEAQQTVTRLKTLAKQKNSVPSAVALAWALAKPAVSGILVGARSEDQLRQNLMALQLHLTSEEISFLEGKLCE